MADKKISALTGASTPLAGTEVLPIVQSGSTVKVAVSDLTLGRSVRVSQLGVGTTAPTNALDVILSQTQVTTRILNQATSANSIATQIISGGNGAVVYQLDNDGLGSVFGAGVRAGTTTNSFFNLRTNNVDRVSIAAAGDVTVNTGNLVIGTANKGIDFSANTHAAGMTSELLNDYEEGTWTPASGVGAATSVSGVYTKVGRQVTVIGTLTFPVQTNGGVATITGLPFASGATGSGGSLRYTDFGSAFFLYGDANLASISAFTTAGAGISYTSISGKRVDFMMTYFV